MIKIKNAFLLLLSIFISNLLMAQEKLPVKYYYSSYDEKPTEKNTAPYIVMVYKNTANDSLWHREMYYNEKNRSLASKGLSRDFEGEVKEGHFDYYYSDGKIWKSGNYMNNNKEEEWSEWDSSGVVTAIEHYTNGHLAGVNLRWLSDGTITDSIVLDKNGTGYAWGFFSDGKSNYVGNYKNGLKDGEWSYYFSSAPNQKSMIAQYLKDSAITYKCFNENGEQQQKDCVFEKEANFPGGIEAWQQYVINASSRIRTEKYLPQGGKYRVIIRFIIDKTGTILNALVEDPGPIKELNDAALKIINGSRKWIPAVQYNRKVNAYRRQPLTFMVD